MFAMASHDGFARPTVGPPPKTSLSARNGIGNANISSIEYEFLSQGPASIDLIAVTSAARESSAHIAHRWWH